ncbi:MBL fold metallo-hydrolase [Bacillus sp. FJAT-29814]|uniref:MBL fold metallo-hydrolase n=1 Tax=Bacillus sp. FJAT-29814 TaxID=1729688 RepID=UPI00082BF94A|nr:MBL fold metallo-hydrolase [Bacillus sp. FJAT-29814]
MQTIKKLGTSFWYMTPVSVTDRPIIGMVVGKDKTLMIDAANSEAHAELFIKMLQDQNVPGPDMVALTHWHWDHIFGLSALKGAVSISSKETQKEMKKLIPYSWTDEALAERVKAGTEIEFCANCIKAEYGDKRDIRITLPTITFEDELEIDLGGVTCVLKHVGGDHAPDSVVIYIKEEKILFLGDCIYPDIFSPKQNYTPKRAARLVAQLEKFDAETYIHSHGQELLSKEEFTKEMQLLKNLAHYTEKHKGDQAQIKSDYEKTLNRELNEEELETIENFVNGYEASAQ